MKREGIGTLFIHGYPWARSYLLRPLAFCFQLFEMVLCVWFFENVLKRGHRCGNLYNDSYFNVYKGVFSFEKCFNVWKICFGKMFCNCVFLKLARIFASFDQVTKSYLPYFTQRSFLYVFNPFDSVVLPLYLVNNLIFGC